MGKLGDALRRLVAWVAFRREVAARIRRTVNDDGRKIYPSRYEEIRAMVRIEQDCRR